MREQRTLLSHVVRVTVAISLALAPLALALALVCGRCAGHPLDAGGGGAAGAGPAMEPALLLRSEILDDPTIPRFHDSTIPARSTQNQALSLDMRSTSN